MVKLPEAQGHIGARRLERVARELLTGIGEDPERDGLRETPRRVAAMLQELTRGIGQDPAAELSVEFHESYHGVIMVRDIPFYSLCEHHLLPFFGTAQVAYHPDHGVLTGLSKLARVVDVASHRPQVQERLTMDIANALGVGLKPQGILVWLQAEHLCMAMRGVEKFGTRTDTIEARGTLAVGQPHYQSLMVQLTGVTR